MKKIIPLLVLSSAFIVACNTTPANNLGSTVPWNPSTLDPAVADKLQKEYAALPQDVRNQFTAEKAHVDFFVYDPSTSQVFSSNPKEGFNVIDSTETAKVEALGQGGMVSALRANNTNSVRSVTPYECKSYTGGPGPYWRGEANPGYSKLRTRFRLPRPNSIQLDENVDGTGGYDSANIYMGGRNGAGVEMDIGFSFTRKPNTQIDSKDDWKLFLFASNPSWKGQFQSSPSETKVFAYYEENNKTFLFERDQVLESELVLNSSAQYVKVRYQRIDLWDLFGAIPSYKVFTVASVTSKYSLNPGLLPGFSDNGFDQTFKRIVSVATPNSLPENFKRGTKIKVDWEKTEVASGNGGYKLWDASVARGSDCRYPSDKYMMSPVPALEQGIPHYPSGEGIVTTNPQNSTAVGSLISVVINTTNFF
jgi:hypothetical protein